MNPRDYQSNQLEKLLSFCFCIYYVKIDAIPTLKVSTSTFENDHIYIVLFMCERLFCITMYVEPSHYDV